MATIGNTNADNSYTRSVGSCIQSLTMPEAGDVTSVWVYCNSAISSGNVYVALFDGITAGNLLVHESAPVAFDSGDNGTWIEIPLEAYEIADAQDFIIAVYTTGELQTTTGAAGGANAYQGRGGSYEVFNPWDDPNNSYTQSDLRRWSFYLEYEPASSGAEVTGTELVQVQAVDAGSISQDHQLTADELAQVSVIDAPTLSQDHQLTAEELVQLQVLDAGSISQDHQLTGTDLVQIQALDAPTVSVTGVLTAEELVQLQALDIPAIVQDHILTAEELVQLQVLDAGSVTQSAVLNALDLVQVQSIDAVVLVVAGVLTAEQLVQIQALDAVVLTQDHQLTAEELVQLQVVAGAGVSIPTDYIPLGRAIIVAKRSRAIQIAKRLRAMRVSR